MKKYLSVLLAVSVLAGISGCGDNKTKEKLLGTSLVTAGSGGSSYTSNPAAASMTALYKVTFAGAGAGDFSTGGLGVIRRSQGMSVIQGAPSGDEGVGLGTPNANGEYVMADPVLGMNVSVAFSKSGTAVYMDFTKLFGSDGLYMYSDDSLTATKTVMNQDFNPLAVTFPEYIPSIWLRADTHQPERWYTIGSLATFSDDFDGLSDWMMGTSFPDLMTTTVTGAVPGGTMNLTMTTTMVARATDANPVSMTGNGTITFDTGERWDIASNLNIGESGPINGTQTFTSTNGNTGTLTFLNGSMDGSVSGGGVVLATIHINADGTGTYTDMATNTTYNITDAQFE